MEELQFGQFGLSVILAVIVGIIFRVAGDVIAERGKVLVMILVGLGLGLLAIPYGGMPWTIVNIVNCLLTGLMSAAAASGFYSWQSKGMTKLPKVPMIAYLLIPLLFIMPVAMNGCTIGATGPGITQNVAWYEDIQNWSPYQRANFFMDMWRTEHTNFKFQNALPGKSPELLKLLKAKRAILEAARIPVRMYASLVNAGGTPDQDIENEIIAWLRQLQVQALQKGGD